MSGWIKLHRSIKRHWIMSDAEYLRAWVIILMEVNHSPQKVMVKKALLQCDEGESLNSVSTWGKLFGNWSRNKTMRFLEHLKSDNMIELQSERVTSRLTVCNYGTYQKGQTAESIAESTADGLAGGIQTRMIKNEENVKNNTVATQKSENAKEVFTYWNRIRLEVPNATLPEARSVTDALARSVNGMITEKFTVEEIKRGINNYAYGLADPNYFFEHRWTLSDFIKRGGGCRKFSDMTEKEAQAQRGAGSKYGGEIPF